MLGACHGTGYDSSPWCVKAKYLGVLISLSVLAGITLSPRISSASCTDYESHLRLAGGVQTQLPAQAVALQGSLAYVAETWPGGNPASGFQVIDISNPASPIILGTLAAPLSFATDVRVSGSFAYVADAHGLYVIDVSNPGSPTIVGTLNTPKPGRGLAVSGSYVYFCAGDAGLFLIDISNPATPILVSSVNIPAGDVALSGSYAFVARFLGLTVVDVSNPELLTIAADLDMPDYIYALDIAVSGVQAYMVDLDGFQVIDISNPLTPVLQGSVITTNQTRAIAISGNLAYLAETDLGVQVFDVTNPLSPTLINGLDTSGEAHGIQVSGSYAYVADFTGGLSIIAVTNLGPLLIGSVTVPGSAQDVAVLGTHAYIAASWEGLQVVNVSNPASPSIEGSLTLGTGTAVAASGSYVYVATPAIRIVDVSNPASPTDIGFAGYGNDVAIVGTRLYVAYNNSLQIFDISNPKSPLALSTVLISAPFTIYYVAISGHYAYLSGWSESYPPLVKNAGIRIVDIADPVHPALVGGLDYPGGHFLGVAALGPYVYVADFFGFIGVIDASNPSSPHFIGAVNVPGDPYDIKISSSVAYVAGRQSMLVLDLSNPATPRMLGGATTSGFSFGVAVSGGNVFIADGTAGLKIFPTQCSAGCSATVNAGGPYESCGSGCVPLDGDVSNESVPVAWTTSGSGTFIPDNTIVDATYCPSAADLVAGSVTLTLTTESCPPSNATLSITPGVTLAALGVDPNTVNTQSGGNFVTAFLEFPPEYDPAQVHLNSVLLNGTVAPSLDFFQVGDWNHNHVPDLALKFARDAVKSALSQGDQVPVTITGAIGDRCFDGTTTVRVIGPHLRNPNGGEVYLPGVRAEVDWENPQGWTVNYAQIYYSADDADSWSLIADRVTGQTYVWAAPQEPTENGRIRVVLVDDQGAMGYDSSDGPFTVLASSTGLPESLPTSYALHQNSPNPFQQSTRVAFDLPEAGKVTLKVFDLSGRVVRALVDDPYPAGTHEVSWNATDAGGKPVAAGIYFLRINAGSFSDSKRMYLRR